MATSVLFTRTGCPGPCVSLAFIVSHPFGYVELRAAPAASIVSWSNTLLVMKEVSMRKNTIRASLIVVSATVLSGCSATTGPAQDATSAPAAASSTSSFIPEPDTPTLDGAVNVNSLPYSLPGTTGYQTSVTFTAVNPGDFPMVSNYRVTVSGGGKVVATTTGGDQVVLTPHQKLLVVDEPSSVQGAAPGGAAVNFYPNQAGQMGLPDPAGWKLSNISPLNCNSGVVGCQLNADLTYQGATASDAQLNIKSISLAFSRSGRVVVAGNLAPPAGQSGQMLPGQPVPVTGYLSGDPGDAAQLTQAYGVQLVAPVAR